MDLEKVNDKDIELYFYENRLKTYAGWPFDEGCACTPENMARAGFIHTPSDNSPDTAMCFFCLKELEGWEPEDDPVKEHKDHSKGCHFISLKKKVEELTVEEFYKLEKERMNFILNKKTDAEIKTFEEKAQEKRAAIHNKAMDEE